MISTNELATEHTPLIDQQSTQGTSSLEKATYYVVINARSGSTDADNVGTTLENTLHAAGRRCEIEVVTRPADLADVVKKVAHQASRNGGVVVAVGGDGAINTVSQEVWRTGCTLGLIPQGTFNLFGRSLNISTDLEAAAKILVTGRPQGVNVGLVNDRVFLVNASVGLYPRLLEIREESKQRFGRNRFVALVSGAMTLFRLDRPIRIKLERDGKIEYHNTMTLFVCNNELQLDRLGVPREENLDRGKLAAVLVGPTDNFSRLGLLVRAAFGRLGNADTINHFPIESIRVRQFSVFRRGVKVAMDGEIFRYKNPIDIAVAPKPLHVIVPQQSVNGDTAV